MRRLRTRHDISKRAWIGYRPDEVQLQLETLHQQLVRVESVLNQENEAFQKFKQAKQQQLSELQANLQELLEEEQHLKQAPGAVL